MEGSTQRRFSQRAEDEGSGLHSVPAPSPALGLPEPLGLLEREAGTVLVSAELLTAGRIIDADAAMATLLGSTVVGLRGTELRDYLRREDPDDAGELADVLAGRRVRAVGLRQLVTAQGTVVECHVSASLTRPSPGQPATVVISVMPLSPALRRARQEASAVRDAFDAAPGGMAIFDSWGRCTRANPAWLALGGVAAEAEADHVLLGLVDDPAAASSAVAEAVGGAEQELVLRSTTADGVSIDVRVLLVPRRADGDGPGGFVAFAQGALDASDEATPASREDDLVGPGHVARTLGISHSTVRRWIEDGRLEAVRTPGGHRRVTRSELRRIGRVLGRRPGRVRAAALPETELPVLAALLRADGLSLTRGAARATYEPDAPGWFADSASEEPLTAWCEGVARAAAAGRPADVLTATRNLFATARDVAALEECLVFADRLTRLLLHKLQQAPGGEPELRHASALAGAMRRSLAALEDERG